MRYGNKQKRRAQRAIAVSAMVSPDPRIAKERFENRCWHDSRALQSVPCRRNSRKPKPSWITALAGNGPRPRSVQAFNGKENAHRPKFVCENDGVRASSLNI